MDGSFKIEMTEAEVRILKNQIEIMWTLSYLLKCAKPNLIGKAGELDHMRDYLIRRARHPKSIFFPNPMPIAFP